MRDAIASLSADDRLVLVLFYVNDFPATDLPDHERVGRCRAHPSVAARDRFKVAYSQGSNEEVEVAR
ncbi:MAG: hypothetical protein ACLSGS_05435 [Adlercreutzia sp.]